MIEIRPAIRSDAQAMADLGRRTFIDTFSKDNTPENMSLYLEKAFGPSIQLKEIEDSNRIIALAWVDERPAGFYQLLKNGQVDPSVQGERPIELLRLYVAKEWLGKGVGPALMEHVIQASGELGFKTLWLGVWERNFRAQKFYRKFNFEVAGAHIFELGLDPQTDLIMSRSI